jgi:hypothetical protein
MPPLLEMALAPGFFGMTKTRISNSMEVFDLDGLYAFLYIS